MTAQVMITLRLLAIDVLELFGPFEALVFGTLKCLSFSDKVKR